MVLFDHMFIFFALYERKKDKRKMGYTHSRGARPLALHPCRNPKILTANLSAQRA
jgi:hypothetical protein